MDHERDPDETEKPVEMPRSDGWLGRIALVLCSSLLSTIISVTAVSIGWKASIDTFSAVTTVKMTADEERIKRLERDQIKSSDLVYRDQLVDAKLAALDIKIDALKDQIANIPVHEGPRR
jgi:hypothetical protein